MSSRVAAAICAALLLLFAILSWSAVAGKSSTVDEPLHALAGYINSTQHDYRIDPEDPPLWTYWMALPNRGVAMKLDMASPEWWAIAQTYWTQNSWWRDRMYATPGNDGEAIVRRSRAMALMIGVALGALVAWYAGRMAGPVAAVAAACLFALDPNFLGHAPLVKNDVAISLLFLATAMATCAVGRRAVARSIALLGVLVGAAMATKFSGLLLIPIVGLMLFTRAMTPETWSVSGRELVTPSQKLFAAVSLFAGTIAIAIVVIWASYGFRYAATADDSAPLNIRLQSALVSKAKFHIRHPGVTPSPEDLAATDPGLLTHAAIFLNDHHLVPEAWLNGLLYTHHQSISRESFLLGRRSNTGWWCYFPLAMLFKTPATTILATVASLGWALRRRGLVEWHWLCLIIPPAAYLAFAMTANLNLGVRHVLPVYPFLFILTGAAFATLWERRRRCAQIVGGAGLLGLAVGSLTSYPNYIAFFSIARGPYQPISLLADSNLDWGQDLPALERWRREHSDRPLYFRYFGTPDPSLYVPDARPLELNHWPTSLAYIAVSATYLQGLYQSDAWDEFLAPLRRQTPIEILGGGTIYVFESPP